MTRPNADAVFDKYTGKPIGLTRSYRGMVGPVIYGTVPVPPSDTVEERIFARISSRESPMRSSAGPSKLVFKDSGSIDGVQAYEPWVSAGAVHWISKNGNLQKLVSEYLKASQEAQEFWTGCGYALSLSSPMLFKKGDEVIESDDLRSDDFCVDMHYLLGFHFVDDPVRRVELQAVGAKVQFNEAWRLVTDRDGILKQEDWYEHVQASPRLRLITADMAINTGTGWFRECLQKAEDFTPEDLTRARIVRYGADPDDPADNGWGKQRANWILRCAI